ncbi:MAG: arsenic metallochaperone ArsD family protein, partial [Anaerococcus sp.]|nr:arsenic metallochaperone ArsD family protein [Anaerococcus sp.]
KKSGASIERYNLTNNTKEFVENKTVNSLLDEKGEDILPVVIVDDEVVMTAKYPSNEEFYEMLFLSDDAKEETNSGGGSCCSGSDCGC